MATIVYVQDLGAGQPVLVSLDTPDTERAEAEAGDTGDPGLEAEEQAIVAAGFVPLVRIEPDEPRPATGAAHPARRGA